eukprot:3107450-Rhodomonas_salina.2
MVNQCGIWQSGSAIRSMMDRKVVDSKLVAAEASSISEIPQDSSLDATRHAIPYSFHLGAAYSVSALSECAEI